MRHLLDISVLFPLFWAGHAHHARCRAWFLKHRHEGWATCAETQLAFVRLAANPAARFRLVGRQPVIYRPVVSRRKVQRKATRSLLERFFGGSANALVLRLLEDEELTPKQLAELKRERKGRGRGDSSKGDASK